MGYLLDTNVVSEMLKTQPNLNAKKWLEAVPSDTLFISVLTLGEIRKGIQKLVDGQRKSHLIIWLDHELPKWFESHILSITQEIAYRWGYLTAAAPRTLPAIDGLLAATCLTHNLKIVTRNMKDFEFPGLEVINPFEVFNGT
jgi:predicted nucleic acid-binding protein